MILDLNYFGKIIKNILILGLYILGIYFCVKIALFYSPFLIAFIIALMIEPLIRKIHLLKMDTNKYKIYYQK